MTCHVTELDVVAAKALAAVGVEDGQSPNARLALRLATAHRLVSGGRSLDPFDARSFGRTVMVIAAEEGAAYACTLSVASRSGALVSGEWCVVAFRFSLPTECRDELSAAWFIWQQTIFRAVSDDRTRQAAMTVHV